MKYKIKTLLIFNFLLFFLTSSFKSKKNFIVLGDSNGAFENGWVNQLDKICKNVNFINFSISGNTIGFNNLGKDTLNTLKNIERYISRAISSCKHIDCILIMLGTNDCKTIYDSLQDQVIKNLDSLIFKIKNYPYLGKKPSIVLITPPPAGNDLILEPKYYGISNRIKNLLPYYKNIAVKYKLFFIDIYTPLQNEFNNLTTDGIHFTSEGYLKIAKIIFNHLKTFSLI